MIDHEGLIYLISVQLPNGDTAQIPSNIRLEWAVILLERGTYHVSWFRSKDETRAVMKANSSALLKQTTITRRK